MQVAGWPTFLARVANFRVLCVSSAWLEAGVMVATTDTRAPLPVMLLCSSRVSLESLKGMCTALPSDSLPMTVPSVSRLLLMKLPSRAWPLVSVACDSRPMSHHQENSLN